MNIIKEVTAKFDGGGYAFDIDTIKTVDADTFLAVRKILNHAVDSANYVLHLQNEKAQETK